MGNEQDVQDIRHPLYRRSEWGTGHLARGLSPAEIRACYVDQATEYANVHPYKHAPLEASWTPYGVEEFIVQRFTERIQQVGQPEFEEKRDEFAAGVWRLSLNPRKDWYPSLQTLDELERAIIEYPSLHAVIKDHLLHNLYNSMGKGET